MSSPIAITGASGFIGRRLAALLVESGVAVRALVRRPARLDDRLRAALEIVEGDILDETALNSLTRGAGAVIHCAGALSSDATSLFSVNVEGTRRLAEAARRAGIDRFVHLSSLAAREPALSPYARSKRQGERALIATLEPEAWVILRPPAVYGPGDKSTLPLLAQLTRRIALLPGTRTQRLSVLYVDDLARALIGLAQARQPAGTIHELHDGRAEGYGWTDFAAAAAMAQGRAVRIFHLPRLALAGVARVAPIWPYLTGHALKPKLNPGKVRELYHPDWVCRHGLLDHVTPWRPEVRFAQGFALTIEWYRQRGWLPQDRHTAVAHSGADQEEPAG